MSRPKDYMAPQCIQEKYDLMERRNRGARLPRKDFDRRLRALEFALQFYLDLVPCENCEEWAQSNEWFFFADGAWCPECFLAATEDPDSPVSEALCEIDQKEAQEIAVTFFTEELLSKWGRWRNTYNKLAQSWPEIFRGYCAEDK
jgi:hypothetical protein